VVEVNQPEVIDDPWVTVMQASSPACASDNKRETSSVLVTI
jgi:hypothetical protein